MARCWRDIYYASFDDLKLHVRHYPGAGREGPDRHLSAWANPERRDFHELATYLSNHPQQAAQRLLLRLSRARQLAIRPQLAELHALYRADRHARFPHLARPAPGRHRRHLARRHHRHADGGGQADSHGSRRAQRYGPGDRDAGLGAHHGLCRAHAGAENLARRRDASCAR